MLETNYWTEVIRCLVHWTQKRVRLLNLLLIHLDLLTSFKNLLLYIILNILSNILPAVNYFREAVLDPLICQPRLLEFLQQYLLCRIKLNLHRLAVQLVFRGLVANVPVGRSQHFLHKKPFLSILRPFLHCFGLLGVNQADLGIFLSFFQFINFILLFTFLLLYNISLSHQHILNSRRRSQFNTHDLFFYFPFKNHRHFTFLPHLHY